MDWYKYLNAERSPFTPSIQVANIVTATLFGIFFARWWDGNSLYLFGVVLGGILTALPLAVYGLNWWIATRVENDRGIVCDQCGIKTAGPAHRTEYVSRLRINYSQLMSDTIFMFMCIGLFTLPPVIFGGALRAADWVERKVK